MPLVDKLLTERGILMSSKENTSEPDTNKGTNTEDLEKQPIPEDKLVYNPKGAGCPEKDKQIPIAKLLRLANKGLSNTEVAKIAGCSRENVSIRLKPFKQAIYALPDYQKRELDLIDLAKQGLLNELIERIYDPETHLKKMATGQITMCFGILTDKGQAIKGKAPAAASNLSVNIVFDPSMLPKSNGAKHLEKIEDSFFVDVNGKVEPAGGGNTGGNSGETK